MEESTPIFDALWEKYNSTPIFDQLAKKYEEAKYEELVKPYQPSITARVFSYEEYLELFNKENKMKKNWQELVNDFREAMDLPVADGPRTLSTHEQELHIKLIREEFENELVPAIMENNLVEIYDAGIDVMYYLIGLLSNAGMQIDPGFREVHESNMSKMDPETGKAILAGPNDPDGQPEGKVLKGPNYFVPKLGVILNEQSKYGHEDTSVYKDLKVPLRLGFGGPKIGEGRIHMDNQGEIMFEGVMDDVSILPVINHLGMDVSAISINEENIEVVDTMPAAGWTEGDLGSNRVAVGGVLEHRTHETGIEGGPIIFNQFNSPASPEESAIIAQRMSDNQRMAAPYDR